MDWSDLDFYYDEVLLLVVELYHREYEINLSPLPGFPQISLKRQVSPDCFVVALKFDGYSSDEWVCSIEEMTQWIKCRTKGGIESTRDAMGDRYQSFIDAIVSLEIAVDNKAA